MTIRIFYSWQNDSEPNTNRYFIREALEAAITKLQDHPGLEEAERPELDHDTKDVAGTPDIFSTILSKVEACDIFVADISLVTGTGSATGEADRLSINPNVAIEYGYALSRLGDGRVLTVLNQAFGRVEQLPFDLRHKRHSIQYSLHDADSKDVRAAQKKRLIDSLAHALRITIDKEVLPKKKEPRTPSYNSIPSTTSRGVFYKAGESLGRANGTSSAEGPKLVPPNGPLMYLRIIPTVATTYEMSKFEATQAARKIPLQPFDREIASRHSINQFGYLTYLAGGEGAGYIKLMALSQLFWNREIWGINFHHLSPDLKSAYKVDFNFVPMGAVYSSFATSLQNYLQVAKEGLNLQLPIEIEAGFVGVRGLRLTMPNNYIEKFGGQLAKDEILLPRAQLSTFDANPNEILMPLYTRLWQEAGHPGVPSGSF